MKKVTAVLLCITISQYGCATSSKNIAASYISPVQYQSYDCDQLSSESLRVQSRVSELTGRLDKAASNDALITTAGVLLFWPALFALGGTKDQEAEYARLKGEYEAIHQSAITKKCTGVVTPQPATAALVGAATESKK